MRRPAASAVILAGALVGVLVVFGAVPLGASADDPEYPTWEQVEAAKKDEKLKRAQIAEIQELIDGLAAKDSELAVDSLLAAEEYNQRHDALDKASAEAEELRDRAETAQDAAKGSRKRVAGIIAQLSRTGSVDYTLQLLAAGESAGDLLAALGASARVSEQAVSALTEARRDSNTARALVAQADAALDIREERADSAAAAYSAAKAAAADAQSNLSAQEAKAKELYAQLASLKGTTSDLEEQYQRGVEWERAQREVKDPPPPPTVLPNPTPEVPAAGAVEGAIAFAQAQLGEGYLLGGAGPDVWDCSGLTLAAYASVGVSIGTHSATNQYATMNAQGRLLALDQLAAGDLLFYSSGGSTSASKYHVTLYIGNGQMIEAPYPGQPVRIRPIRYGDLVPLAGRPTP
jgi:cell wall-associated NlpC family hydrolase